jgi:predicted dehydrogenase
MSVQQRVRVGVIGCGYWGPKIIRNLSAITGADLAMVCDMDAGRLQAVAENHPSVATTMDHKDLLGDPSIDAVVIATPIRTHFRLALAALFQGKHVLIEKPLTASVEESEQLVETAEMTSRVLMVGHTYQYNPAVAKLRELVQSGELGHVFYVDCARLNLGLFQRDINVMWDLAPHDVSILLHILGDYPLAVSASGASHVLKGVDDLAHLYLRFAPDINAYVRLSWLDPCKVRRVTVVGSRKMALFDDTGEEKLQIHNRGVAVRVVEGFPGPEFDYHNGDIEVPVLDEVEPLRAQLEHFLHCVRTGQQPLSDGQMGLDVVRVIAAADTSSKQGGRWIELEPPANAPLRIAAAGGLTGAMTSRAV